MSPSQTALSVSLSLDRLLLLRAGVIAQSTTFWFSTSSVRKAIRIVPQRSALLLHSLSLISDDVKGNTEQCSVMLWGQIRRRIFLHLVESLCQLSVCRAHPRCWGLHNRKMFSIVSLLRIVFCFLPFSCPFFPFYLSICSAFVLLFNSFICFFY